MGNIIGIYEMINYNSLLPSLSMHENETFYSKFFNKFNRKYSTCTNSSNKRKVKCANCGAEFFRSSKKQGILEFCDLKCSGKYYGTIKHKKNIEKAKNIVHERELKEFIKKYTNFVYSVAYKEFTPLAEDIIDYFYYNSLVLLANLKLNKIENNNTILKYIHTSLTRHFLYLKEQRKNEIFYSELSIKNQIKILGDVIEERM